MASISAATGQVASFRVRSLCASASIVACAVLFAASGAEARITRIVIDTKESPAYSGQSFGAAGQYERLIGRAFGELDPKDPHNAIITDIDLAQKNANGKVEYMASFLLVKPIDMSKSSHLMWHDVPNRGGRLDIGGQTNGDVGLSSGWQGDNSGGTAPGANNDYVVVPIAVNADGSPITGKVLGRIMNASGVNSQQMFVHSNPVPYKPASLDTTRATLETHDAETIDGVVTGVKQIASTDWAWARCSATNPFPGTPDPTQICVKGGFDSTKLYQVVFTAKDPYVLGVGAAAFRDLATFLKFEAKDDAGNANPVAGQIKWTITRGVSQSGNFIRAFLHLGFNQDEKNRMVYDGAWPIIAGRRAAVDFRWAMPDGVLKLYEPGSEGPQWWADWPDPRRGLPTNGILHRCTQTNTCPKIIEHFGAAEVWGLKLTPEWVGTNADVDIPLPSNVRRYYIPSTQHGGGNGGFSTVLAAPPSCPSNGYGTGTFPANPVPHTETRNAIQFHFRNWVMQDIAPPPSMYPTLNGPNHELVAPTKQAMGFPTIPGVSATAPTGLINPVLDYDFGPQFNYSDATGVPTTVPPIVKQVIPAVVPRVDIDGNEIGGVPVVLRLAPLGTYLGWNITAAGFNKDKICNYAGGMIPFPKTLAERTTTGDPRLSLQERYGNHAGYVAAVQIAADKAVASGFLLADDAKALVAQAAASDVLNDLPATDGSVRVVEFTRNASGQYFVTADQAEIEALDRTTGAGAWTRTGQQFRAWPRTGSAPSGAVNVCRVAGVPNVGPTDHLFSADANECAALAADRAHWISEGTAFRTIAPQNGQCPGGHDAVVRMWKPSSTLTSIRHRLLTDPTQISLMLAAGWSLEGPVFCSPK